MTLRVFPPTGFADYGAHEVPPEVATGGSGIAGITVKDEGVGVGTAAGITSIDFVGTGVTATAVGANATVTIPSGAPTNSSYVVIALDATLTAERNLAVTAPMTLTDGGANAAVTLATPVMVASGGSHAKGLTPDTPATAGTVKYLREDATWVDPSVIPTIVGGSLGGKRSGLFVSSVSFNASWGGLQCATVAGSHTTALSTNKADSYLAQYWQAMDSAPAANSNALAQINAAGTAAALWFGGVALSGGFYFKGRAGTSDTWVSGWAQFWGLRAAVTNPAGGANPSTFVDSVGIGYDTTDANLQIMNNDSAGTCTKTDLGASFAIAAKQLYDYEIWCDPNSATFNYRVVNLSTNAVASGSISTNTPTAGTGLQWVGGYVTNAATAVAAHVHFGGAFYETIG